MESCTSNNENQTEDEIVVDDNQEVEQLTQCLPKAPFMGSKIQLVKYNGFWYPVGRFLKSVLAFQRQFRAQDTDLIIASLPKTGTTWLKSLLFAVINRGDDYHQTNNQSQTQSLLLSHNPHELICCLEAIYAKEFNYPQPQHLDELASPRLFQTHLPYTFLNESIKSSKCRILYISRNPLDTFVSHWHYIPNLIKKATGSDDFQPPSIEDYFEDCCEGRIAGGPFFDHVLSYWKQSLEQPDKVLFLKYEDLKEDAEFHLKRLADFVGMPFSPQEESEGVIEHIIDLCSIKNLKELEVNKSGLFNNIIEKNTFFRKGEVGDWTNYFTPAMAERMNKLMEENFKDTGLSFKLLPQ